MMVIKPIVQKCLSALGCILIFATACSGKPESTRGIDQPSENSSPSSAVNQDFSAQINALDQVVLTWKPVAGAENYQVEFQVGGDEYVPLANLPKDASTFIDENTPAETNLTYRLSVIANSKTIESKLMNIDTPVGKIKPQNITVAFDQSPAVIDPKTLDPETFDASKFDANNFDPSMFMPQPLQTQAVVGPKGGDLKVTGINNVTYTLNIPADSLDFEVTITLKPISDIPDLPLSKGLVGAVFIEPQEAVFRIPATLTITSPEDIPTPQGSLLAGFAFDANGQEFHLFPTVQNSQADLGLHTARLMSHPVLQESSKGELQVPNGGGYGKGNGTPAEIKKVASSDPSNVRDGTAQDIAAAQLDLDDLAPLTNIPREAVSLAKTGEKISQHAQKADNWNKFMDTLDELTTYMNSEGGKYNKKLNEKIIASLLEKANALLQKNKGECLSEDDLKAQELLERLVNPKDDFSKTFSARFKEKFGQKLVDDLYNGLKACTYQLQMTSNLSYDVEGSVLFTSMETQKIPLNFLYVKGAVFLWGTGPMKLETSVSGPCSFPIQHYDGLTLLIQNLSPIFDKGKLVDFAVKRLLVLGWTPSAGGSGSGNECTTLVRLSGGGDYWTGMFTMARASLKNELMTEWEIQQGDFSRGGSLKANWESVVGAFPPMGSSGTMSEDTKLELIIIPGKK